MEPIYVCNILIDDAYVDRFGRLTPARILYIAQEAAGEHSTLLSLGYDSLAARRLFWAVTRHRVEVTRIPLRGETLRVETWPMPATRSSYPRSVIAYDSTGAECFRVLSLWVLMDLDTRRMIPPGKSGISLAGTVRGNELALPGSLVPRPVGNVRPRRVVFSDLDRNGHMNNTRCMDWIADLLPSEFHREHTVREFTVCYLAEAREQEELQLNLEPADECTVQVDAFRGEGSDAHRVFSAKLLFETDGIL